MEIPSDLFWLSALLFAALSIQSWVRMHREQSKINNVVFTLMFLGFTWSVFAAFHQVELAALAWISAMIISVIMLPELDKYTDEQIKRVDIESPMKLHDFMTGYSGWLKLANKRGVSVAVAVYFINTLIVAGILLAAINYRYNIPVSVSAYFLTFIPFSTIRLYKQLQKWVNRIEPVLMVN